MSTPQPIFYKNVVPLSKEQHSELFMESIEGFGFANDTNSIYIAAVEFPQAAREYPIVFGKDPKGIVFPVALLGVKQNQNLFVDEKDMWNASYIPAYARRYPFILARGSSAEQQYTVCIDESYRGFNTAKEGQPLFNEQGEQTELLTKAVGFLQDYQSHVELTSLFCENLVTLELLEPMTANIEMRSGEKLSVGGFHCVSRDKLKALEPGKLADLVKTDQMELIYSHLHSLKNVNALMEKLV